MGLDIAHCLELQQLFFLDPDSETGIGFDQNFVEAEGINPNVLHQECIRSDHGWIRTGDAMQDLDKASLQLLRIGGSLSQHL